MFFLIRCTFWLSIVFYSMPWPQSPALQDGLFPAARNIAAGMAGDLAAAAGTAAKAKLEEACIKFPADCIAAAARMPQFVAIAPAPEAIGAKGTLPLADSGSARAVSARKLVSASQPPAPHELKKAKFL
jgi:hypothetical protein